MKANIDVHASAGGGKTTPSRISRSPRRLSDDDDRNWRSRSWSNPSRRADSPRRSGWTLKDANLVRLDSSNSATWAINHHLPNLVKELHLPKRRLLQRGLDWIRATFGFGDDPRKMVDTSALRDGKCFRVSFAELQRMKMRKLQCVLVGDVVYMRNHGSEPPNWERSLDDYGKSSSQQSQQSFLRIGITLERKKRS